MTTPARHLACFRYRHRHFRSHYARLFHMMLGEIYGRKSLGSQVSMLHNTFNAKRARSADELDGFA